MTTNVPDGRLKPTREEFYQLVMTVQREHIAKLEARLAIAESEKKLAALVVKYGGDPELTYRLDEQACELMAV